MRETAVLFSVGRRSIIENDLIILREGLNILASSTEYGKAGNETNEANLNGHHVAVNDWTSIDQVVKELSDRNYVIERSLATAVFLSLKLQKPLLLEGEAGVGKTEIAKVLA